MNSYIVQLRDIRLKYGDAIVLDGIDLNIGQGEVIGIYGPNGSGKTSLLNIVSGFTPPSSGIIELGDCTISGAAPSVVAEKGIRRCFQVPKVCLYMSVWENVAVGKQDMKGSSLFEAIARLRSLKAEEASLRQEVKRSLEISGIQEWSSGAHVLSKGQRRLVSLCRMLIGSARLYLYDEPTSGLSDDSRDSAREIMIRTLSDDATGVVIEHDRDFLGTIADHMLELRDGRLRAGA